MSPDDLRKRAIRFRAIADRINDAQSIKALHDLAAEYEAQANSVEAQRTAEAPGNCSGDRD
jgi:hypothetical protein